MAYCDEEDVRDRAPAIPDDSEDDPEHDPEHYARLIAAGVAAADGEIDGALRGRYPVPFSPVPDLVHSISVDLAAAHALGSSFSGTGANAPLEFITFLQDGARKLLAQLALGKLLLPSPDDSATSQPVRPAFLVSGEPSKIANFDFYGRNRRQWP